ncbi:MAG: enoyl-CoA hydratase/isomerase family protein [Pseudomonadota bacterium]
MSDTQAPVILQEHDGWAEVVMNRPERKNAITGPFGAALAECMAQAASSDNIRLVVLRGAGGAFCSGLDLKEFNAEPAPSWLADFQGIWRGAHKALFECPKPIIGALERYAINGGAALALACDLLVVGEESFLQVGEVQIGMGAPYNMAWMSLRHPEHLMAQIALVGDRIHGPAMVDLGIAHACVADEVVLAHSHDLAQRLADFPGAGLAGIKAGLRARLEVGADAWFDRFVATSTGAKPRAMK